VWRPSGCAVPTGLNPPRPVAPKAGVGVGLPLHPRRLAVWGSLWLVGLECAANDVGRQMASEPSPPDHNDRTRGGNAAEFGGRKGSQRTRSGRGVLVSNARLKLARKSMRVRRGFWTAATGG
jgi:hypothetical protein